MKAGLAKIHVPFLYARIFATGHPLLSAQNFPPFFGRCAKVWSYRRMEATHRGSHVPSSYAPAPRWTSAVISQNFPPFLGETPRSQIDFKHRALSHPRLIYFNSLELTDGTSAVISQNFLPFLGEGHRGRKLTSSTALYSTRCLFVLIA